MRVMNARAKVGKYRSICNEQNLCDKKAAEDRETRKHLYAYFEKILCKYTTYEKDIKNQNSD